MPKRQGSTIFVAFDSAEFAVDEASRILKQVHLGAIDAEQCAEYAKRAVALSSNVSALAVALENAAKKRAGFAPVDIDIICDDAWFKLFEHLKVREARNLATTCRRMTGLYRLWCRVLYVPYMGSSGAVVAPFISFSPALRWVRFGLHCRWDAMVSIWRHVTSDAGVSNVVCHIETSQITSMLFGTRVTSSTPLLHAPMLFLESNLRPSRDTHTRVKRLLSRCKRVAVQRLVIHSRYFAVLDADIKKNLTRLVVFQKEYSDQPQHAHQWIEFVGRRHPFGIPPEQVAFKFAETAFSDCRALQHLVWCWVRHNEELPHKRIFDALRAPLPELPKKTA